MYIYIYKIKIINVRYIRYIFIIYIIFHDFFNQFVIDSNPFLFYIRVCGLHYGCFELLFTCTHVSGPVQNFF